MRREIEDILDELQVNVKLLGYKYWISAVEICLEAPYISMSKLYKQVAEKHNTTSSRVERALRSTYQDNVEIIQKYFNVRYNIDNSTVLKLLAREVERKQNESL